MEEALDNENKIRRVEAPWEELLASNRDVAAKVDKMYEKLEGLDRKVEAVVEGQRVADKKIAALEMEVVTLKQENRTLKGNYELMRHDLDDQIDRSLRDHINFFGLTEITPEKTWAHTESRLAGWLAEHTEKDAAYYKDAIGPTEATTFRVRRDRAQSSVGWISKSLRSCVAR